MKTRKFKTVAKEIKEFFKNQIEHSEFDNTGENFTIYFFDFLGIGKMDILRLENEILKGDIGFTLNIENGKLYLRFFCYSVSLEKNKIIF